MQTSGSKVIKNVSLILLAFSYFTTSVTCL